MPFLALLKLAATGLWGFLRAIPWQVWVALGIALAVLLFGHARYKAGYAEAESHYMAEFKRLEQARVDATKRAQDLLDEQARLAAEQAREHERRLVEADRRRQRELADLRGRINVTAENTRSCPDVPRGYLVFRAAAAAHANGVETPAAAGDTRKLDDEPSGVSLPALAETDLGQADAFRQAVTWGEGWRDHALTVRSFCEATFKAMTR